MNLTQDTPAEEKIELQMAPMIDIVFQLLIFFLLTFKIVAPEGRFEFSMPDKGSKPTDDPVIPDVQIRLHADPNGMLRDIVFGARSLGNQPEVLFRELNGLTGGKKAFFPVEIDSDPNLNFEFIIQTLNACSKARVEEVKFAPRRGGSG